MRERDRSPLKVQMLILTIIICWIGCGGCGCTSAQPYEYIQSPSGQQMVVVHDGRSSFVMEAMAFQMLMNSGGYNNVIHHYHSYPTMYPRYNQSSYSGWRSMPRSYRPSYNSNPSPRNSFRSTQPSPPTQFRTTSPILRNSFRSTTPSTRSTFRSTSPSRSSRSSFRH